MQWKIVKWNFFKLANCIKLLYIYIYTYIYIHIYIYLICSWKEGLFFHETCRELTSKDQLVVDRRQDFLSVAPRSFYAFFFQSIGFRWISQLTRRVCPLKPLSYPIVSMYAIYGNIYHKYTPNVSIYTIHGSYGYMGMALGPTVGTANFLKGLTGWPLTSAAGNADFCLVRFAISACCGQRLWTEGAGVSSLSRPDVWAMGCTRVTQLY